MGPRREDPSIGPSDEGVPRRVRHLIVLPGGGDGGATHGIDADREDAARQTTSVETGPVARIGPPAAPAAFGPGPAAGAAALAAEAIPLALPEPPRLKLSLKVISRTVSAPRAPGVPFILFASGLVSLAILGLVILNVMVDQSSFRLGQLDGQVTAQQAQIRQLDYGVSVSEAPARLAELASRIGLVPAAQIKSLEPTASATPAGTPPAPPSPAQPSTPPPHR